MISFVIASRADARSKNIWNEIRDQRKRLMDACCFDCAFVVVEWGSPRDGCKPLHEDFAAIVVYVSDEVANLYSSPAVFNEYTAKNVGVRAAMRVGTPGPPNLIVACNSDLVFSPELCAVLEVVTKKPDGGLVYRAPRWDFDGVAADGSMNWGTRLSPEDAAGDFTGMHALAWQQLQGYWQSPQHRWHLDSELVQRARAAGLFVLALPPVWHQVHEGSGGARGLTDDALYKDYGAKPGGGENWGLADREWVPRAYGWEVL
jgi:hypothetical protein